MMKILNEMKDMVFILLVTGVFSWVANLINIHPDLGASAIGVFLLSKAGTEVFLGNIFITSFRWCSGSRSWP